MTAKRLKIALLHLSVEYGQPERNLANLLDMAKEAIAKGAKLLVTPEMSLSGYCYENRESIKPHAQTESGPAVTAFRALAKEYGVYVALALAELNEPLGMLHNAAFFLDDKGRILGRSRKINAESRWACPGEPIQVNIWPSPWGQVAVHICSDSWNSLIPRISAVKGADLLILPANWPPTGLDPLDLWRFRARENGLWFVACNRTGLEEKLDCLNAASGAFDPYGRELFRGRSPVSQVFYVNLPLDSKGKLDSTRRQEILAARKPAQSYRLYGNWTGLANLTSFLRLNEPGPLDLKALIPPPGVSPAAFASQADLSSDSLYLLPTYSYSKADAAELGRLFRERAAIAKNEGREWLFFGKITGQRVNQTDGLFLIDYGPARIWLATDEEIHQPEPTIAAAKFGADLALGHVPSLTPDARLLAAIRPVDQLAAAIVAPDGAAFGLLWQGHDAGRGAFVNPGEVSGLTLDTRETRDKRFQDRLDFAALFRG
ncbi:MAG: carbon-nitrogen hydrolase family protein [Deltaproteobacteria bacterium]|jgi:predicted amidohydrolase|nr:carbon-nitrogen hydrolase family protein [Deltaproteobacteria bacterium]